MVYLPDGQLSVESGLGRLLVFDDEALPLDEGGRQDRLFGIVQVVEGTKHLGLVGIVEKELGPFRQFILREQ